MQSRGEHNMRPRDDPEVIAWTHKRDAELEDSGNTEVPWLRANFDEVPTPMWKASSRGWCREGAVSQLHAKKEGSIWQEIPEHGKMYFTSGFCTTPFSMGRAWFHFKDKSPGGEKMVQTINQKLGHKGYCLAAMVDVLCAVLSGGNWGPTVE